MQENVKEKSCEASEICFDTLNVDFGCHRGRDRDRDRDRDGGSWRPSIDFTGMTNEELKKRVEYSF